MRILTAGSIVPYDFEVYLLCYDITSPKKPSAVAVRANFVIPPLSLIKIEQYSEQEVTGGKLFYLGARKIIHVEKDFISFVQDKSEFLKYTLPLVDKKITNTNALLYLFLYYILKQTPEHYLWDIIRFSERFTEEEKKVIDSHYQNRDKFFQDAAGKFIKYTYKQYLIFEAEKELMIRISESDFTRYWQQYIQTVRVSIEGFFSFAKEFFSEEIITILEKELSMKEIRSYLQKAQGEVMGLIKQISKYRQKNQGKKWYFFTTFSQEQAKNLIENAKNDVILLTGEAGAGKTTLALDLRERYPDKYFITTAIKNENSIKHNLPTIQGLISKIKNRDQKTLSSLKGKTLIVDEAGHLADSHLTTLINLLNTGILNNLVLIGDIGQNRVPTNPNLIYVLSLVPETTKIELEKVSYRFQDLYVVIDTRYDTYHVEDILQISEKIDDIPLKMAISDEHTNMLTSILNQEVKKTNKAQGDEYDEVVLFLKYYVSGGIRPVYTGITRARKVAYVFLHKNAAARVWLLMNDIKMKFKKGYNNARLHILYNGNIVVDTEDRKVQYRPATDDEKKELLEKVPRLKILYPDIFIELKENSIEEVVTSKSDNNIENYKSLESQTLIQPEPELQEGALQYYVEPWEQWSPEEVSISELHAILLKKGDNIAILDEDDFGEWIEPYLEREFPEPAWPTWLVPGAEEKTVEESTLNTTPSTTAIGRSKNEINKLLDLEIITKILKLCEKIMTAPTVLSALESGKNKSKELSEKQKKKGRKPTTSIKIIRALQEHPEGLTFSEIHEITKISKPTLKKLLNILKKENKIKYEGGKYMIVDEEKIDRIDQNVKDIKEIITEIKSIITEILEYYRKKEESMYIRRPEVGIDPTKIRH